MSTGGVPPRKSIHTPEHQALAALLRRAREDAGLRQIDLAARLGRPQSFVAKYEAGERRLDLVELRAIAKALGIPLQTIVKQLDAGLRKAPARRRNVTGEGR